MLGTATNVQTYRRMYGQFIINNIDFGQIRGYEAYSNRQLGYVTKHKKLNICLKYIC